MTHVFISYSRKDTPFVVRLEAELNKLGIATWRDATSIPGGDDWYQNIVTGLSGAYAILCIVTPNADESKWVRREQLRADEDGIPPVVVQPTKHRNPLHLQEVQPILMDAINFNAGLLALVVALERLRQHGSVVAAPSPAPPSVNDEAVVQEYLKWVLSDGRDDLRDALYVELEATPEHRSAR